MLPRDVLLEPFADRDALPNGSHAIGVVCPQCRCVSIHFLEQRKIDSSPEGGLVSQEPFENMETFCEAMLPCEGPTCRFLLPIVLEVNRSMTDEAYKEYRSTWTFFGLTCPNGHPILKPADW